MKYLVSYLVVGLVWAVYNGRDCWKQLPRGSKELSLFSIYMAVNCLIWPLGMFCAWVFSDSRSKDSK